MGRTEDVRFAPSGRRLAFACYADERIAVADVEITRSASGPEIAVTSLELLQSPALHEPHGIDFVDDDTLVVGNRAGGIVPLRLPPPGVEGELTPIDGGQPRLVDAPGSVAVRSLGDGRHEVLACDNWANTVTRHTLGGDGALTAGEVIARKWLDLPDGLALSGDGHWLAVSNHNSHNVLVFAYPTVSEESDPVGILRGVHYPHGLRFVTGDRHLFVADAGAPHVHVFAASTGGWHGVGYPAAAIRVMDDETFARGHVSPEEGGPKGIDVEPRTSVLAVTSECQPLAFFDVAPALDRSELDGVGESLIRYELARLAETARIKAEAVDARAQLTELVQTKAWRMTKPARRAYGAALRLKARRSHRRFSALP